ncbi:MAG TPA: vWA domain-containing protein, partial [Polyangiaceae bacterium]|nr:vWA domain-containing protein [Polyangiaceae bacterium]
MIMGLSRLGRLIRPAFVVALSAFGASSIFGACGGSDNDEGFDPRSRGQGGSSASGGNGGTLPGTGGSILGNDGSSGEGGELTPDAACAVGNVEATLEPVALLVMLDTSSSMVQDGSQKWANAKQGISSFVSSPTAAGLKVALTYFPNNDAACDGSGYDLADVTGGAGVAMGILPGNAAAITTSINAKATTSNGTPTEDALNGIRRYCTQYVAQNPTERCVGVLVTDGEPNGCSNDITTLGNVAAASFGGNPSIPIYVMGMTGAVFTTLNTLASRGGTQQAINVNDGGSNAFLQALNTIRGQVVSCDFPIPSGANIDVNRVNIQLTTAAGTVSLGRVASAGQCV